MIAWLSMEATAKYGGVSIGCSSADPLFETRKLFYYFYWFRKSFTLLARKPVYFDFETTLFDLWWVWFGLFWIVLSGSILDEQFPYITFCLSILVWMYLSGLSAVFGFLRISLSWVVSCISVKLRLLFWVETMRLVLLDWLREALKSLLLVLRWEILWNSPNFCFLLLDYSSS